MRSKSTLARWIRSLIKNRAEFDLKSYESVEDPERQQTVKETSIQSAQADRPRLRLTFHLLSNLPAYLQWVAWTLPLTSISSLLRTLTLGVPLNVQVFVVVFAWLAILTP